MGKLKKLQNGADIRGIALENNDKEVNLTAQEIYYIGQGFIKWIKEEQNNSNQLKIAIGMDSRISGPKLKKTLIESISKTGCFVYDCDISTTPAMFMATVLENYECDGAVMITASHLPYYYNGLKFFTKKGGCENEDIKRIIELATYKQTNEFIRSGKVEKANLIDDYSNYLVKFIRRDVNSKTNYCKPLKGLKIIVDAGNGSGGFFVDKVLKQLGACTDGSQFLNPDGLFPNHIPNPENKEAMKSIREAVIKNNADLGIIFDTDVDRSAIVGDDGLEINRNSLIALISAIILEDHPNSTIVTDSITSTGLKEFIESKGGVHHRFKRGYKNVINESKRLNYEGIESHLAIETSGHAAVKENYFLDDGAYLISKILVKMAQFHEEGRKVTDLISSLKKAKESKEVRIGINKNDFKTYGETVISELEAYVNEVEGWYLSENNYEGIKVFCKENRGNGWFLLRISLHEPLLPLNIESNEIGGIDKIISNLLPYLGKYTDLNIDKLKLNKIDTNN
ncbi:phosphomannomutase/phosphoglucomutase [Terrisporobacter mayombei]|uniref:phosphomannomutase/phosphoglucomutase n=1 Tax=Terrisporobacter mayombei TaxID=1541 RepID=UPI003F69A88E